MPVTPFSVSTTEVDGLNVVELKQVTDERGTVRELFRTSEFKAAGLALPERWEQVNVTASRRGAVRGLHGEEVTKLVSVVAGTAFGAYLDARRASASFGRVVTVELRPGRAVLVPPGVCNGFQATGAGWTEYCYCFDREWQPGMQGVSVNPFDPALAVPWPIAIDTADRSLLSEKDANLPTLAEASWP